MRISAFILSIVVLLTPAMSNAFDMGPLNKVLDEGSSGAWTITDNNGAAIFRNATGPGDIRYYFVGAQSGEEGHREISVDVGLLETSKFSKAGLLYGFEQDPRTYFLFTVDSNQIVRLEYRGTDGWEERMSSKIAGLNKENITLTIREKGNSVSLLVNGKEGTSLGNDRLGRGGVGIAAVGTGTYRFRNFDIATPKVQKSQTKERSLNLDFASSDNQKRQDLQTAGFFGKSLSKLKFTNTPAATEAPITTIERSAASDAKKKIPDSTIHVKVAEIIDQNGFKKPVRAASMLVPADWSVNGTVGWVIEGCKKGTHVVFDAIAPDKKTNVSRLPTTTATWSSLGRFNNCLFHRAERAEHMINSSIDGVLENPTVIETIRVPELTQQLKQFSNQSNGLNVWTDHLIATVDHDRFGEKHRAFVLLITTHMQTFSPMIDGIAESLIATALPIIYSGPRETQDRGDYSAGQALIMNSFRADPEWQARMNRHNNVIADDNLKTAQEINNINREATNYIANLREDSRRNSDAASDRNYRRTLEALTETQTVKAKNGPVLVPAGNVWEAEDGSMFVSQEDNFDPRDFGIEAKKLQPVR